MIFCPVRGPISVLRIGTNLIDISKHQGFGKNSRPFLENLYSHNWQVFLIPTVQKCPPKNLPFNSVSVRQFSFHDSLKCLKWKCFFNSCKCQKHVPDFKLSRFSLCDDICILNALFKFYQKI